MLEEELELLGIEIKCSYIREDIQADSVQRPVTKGSSGGKEGEKDGEAIVSSTSENIPTECNDKYDVDDRDSNECHKSGGREHIANWGSGTCGVLECDDSDIQKTSKGPCCPTS